MINGAPSHCSGFPASSAASRRSGRSDRSRYPNEGEENRRVGDLIGYTWKTTVSSLKCKTPGRGRRDRLGVPSHLFPSDSEGGKKKRLPLFRQLSFLRFVLNKIGGDNRDVREAAEETQILSKAWISSTPSCSFSHTGEDSIRESAVFRLE